MKDCGGYVVVLSSPAADQHYCAYFTCFIVVVSYGL